jgi:hypothetical protein
VDAVGAAPGGGGASWADAGVPGSAAQITIRDRRGATIRLPSRSLERPPADSILFMVLYLSFHHQVARHCGFMLYGSTATLAVNHDTDEDMFSFAAGSSKNPILAAIALVPSAAFNDSRVSLLLQSEFSSCRAQKRSTDS